MELELGNKRLPDHIFFQWREEVLERWPTGREVNLDDAIAYHKSLPESRVYSKVLAKAKIEGWVPIGTAIGQTTHEATLEHLKFVEASGADLLSIYVDTYTRKSRYDLAQQALEESLRTGRLLLNGYPIVNYGVNRSRLLIEAVDVPIRIAGHVDEEPMLSAEIGLATGCTSNSSHDFSDLVQHCKGYPLSKRILNNQYNARLMGYYEEHGAPIEVQQVATLSGFFPPALNIVANILSALINAEQRVKHTTLAYAQQCNLIQDVAAIDVCRKLGKEYLHKFGYDDVVLSLCVFHWMGDFPRDEYQAYAVIAWNAAIDALSSADWVWTKTPHEGHGIPTKEAEAIGIVLTKQVYNIMKGQRLPQSEELETEKEMLELEVRSIVDAVIEMGQGDVAIGEVRAAEAGVLDVPFPSWKYARGEVLPVRDAKGAVRYFSHGRLPLPEVVIDYHKAKIEERARAEATEPSIEMVIKDVRALSQPLIKDIVRSLA